MRTGNGRERNRLVAIRAEMQSWRIQLSRFLVLTAFGTQFRIRGYRGDAVLFRAAWADPCSARNEVSHAAYDLSTSVEVRNRRGVCPVRRFKHKHTDSFPKTSNPRSTVEISGYLNDGYSEMGFIAAAPGLYPALTFTFRPMLPADYAAMLGVLTSDRYVQIRKDMAAAIAKRVSEWDLRDRQGQAVPITTDAILYLKEPLLVRLFNIVSCRQPSDEQDSPIDLEGDAKN